MKTRIREVREKAGKTMKDVAKELGIKYTTYISYDNGTYEPNSNVLIAMAKYFNVSTDYLVGASDDPRTTAQKQQEETELAQYLEMLRTRPEMRILLDTVTGATREEVEANVHFLEALRGKKE